MPALDRRLCVTRLCAAMLAFGFAAEARATERVQTQLQVRALVVSACTISAGAREATCTSGERPTISTDPMPAAVRPAATAERRATSDVKLVTLTY